MKKFDQELTDLQHRLVQMAERAESMLALAVDSLDSIDDKTRENIHEQEQELDQMQMDVDQEVVRMLTVFTPVASDLRYLLTTSHIATSLERMGDQATNIINSAISNVIRTNNNNTLPIMTCNIIFFFAQTTHAAITTYTFPTIISDFPLMIAVTLRMS